VATSTTKIIVLTGATRGLGRALLDHFVPHGYRVFGCGRSAKHVGELQTLFAGKASLAVVDVTDAAGVASWAKDVLAQAGPPDLLINNAAIMNKPAPLWTISQAEFDSVIDINIKGTTNVIRSFVPAMVARKSGVIVNLSSGWGRSTSAEVAPYCATKYAVEGLTLALAQELPRGMAAIPLNPGVIDTDMLRSCWSDTSGYQSPAQWAKKAAPMLLGFGPRDNGKSLTV
jgi:NAD(P)-dependent dehydrogenase (short-subunit alcohol dehydrogenase family)